MDNWNGYTFPPEEDVQGEWRLLDKDPGECIEQDDQIWNWYFKAWARYNEYCHSMPGEFGPVQNHRYSSRLCIIRRRADKGEKLTWT